MSVACYERSVPWEPLPGSRPDATSLGSSLDRVVGALGGPGAAALQAVFGRWAEVVGAPVAEHAQPMSLRDGRLLVAVDDPAWVTEVRFQEAELLAKLAEVAGAGQVRAIDVRVRGAGRPDR